jgi:hypothetical protein
MKQAYLADLEIRIFNENTLGVVAEAEILIPFDTNNSTQIMWKSQKINTGGLWQIESDSPEDYLLQIAAEELAQLKYYLEVLNVDVENFENLKQAALQFEQFVYEY